MAVFGFLSIAVASIGTLALLLATIVTTLAVCGAPVGEYVTRGHTRVLPTRQRVTSAFGIVLHLFAIFVLWQTIGFIPWVPSLGTRSAPIVLAMGYTAIAIMNALSKSGKERRLMAPVSAIAALCCWAMGLMSLMMR